MRELELPATQIHRTASGSQAQTDEDHIHGLGEYGNLSQRHPSPMDPVRRNQTMPTPDKAGFPRSTPPLGLYLIWMVLIGEALRGLVTGAYSVTFIAMGTIILTLAPLLSQRLLNVSLPSSFIVAIAAFLLGTLVLGEARAFYKLYWWWDLVLHAGSAMGFGLIGVILMLILVRGDKISAAPITVSVFAFSFAVMIGVLWEIFEFWMDQSFGLNMQKSGLVDTMWDLIINCLGAGVGALAGWLYMIGHTRAPLAGWIREFVMRNRRFFRPEA